MPIVRANTSAVRPELVHRGHDDVAWVFIVELLDPLAEISFDDFDANRGHVMAKTALLGQHRFAFDQRLGAVILQDAVDEVNSDLSRFEQIKRFAIVPREFSAEEGEVTPTLKLKRRVIEEHFAAELGRLYPS